jgi:carboxyl-terminal processing protease
MVRLFVASGLSVTLALGPACSGSRQTTRAAEATAGTSTAAEASRPPPDPREQNLAGAVGELLQERHLRHKKIDDEVSRASFTEYLDNLDPQKMYLLASDAASLQPHADRIDDELAAGRLDLAHEGDALYVKRVGVVQQVVAEILAKPMALDDDETIETDPKKLQRCTTEDELKTRWRKRLELEVLERIALMEEMSAPKKDGDDDDDGPPAIRGPIPTTPEGRETKAREDLARSYAGRFARLQIRNPLDPASLLLNSIAATYDPHTEYMPPANKKNFEIHMGGTLEGIGALLREDEHNIAVQSLVPGGASWRQGQLEAGDIILSVSQEGKEPVDTLDMRLDDVVKMVRGPKGTVVTLVVKKPTDEVQTVRITRDVVVIEESYARGATLQVKGGKVYGYIYLPSFYGVDGGRTAKSDVERLLRELRAKKVSGVVLDLRSNGGGLLNDSVELAGLFVDEGPIVQTQVYDGTRTVLADEDRGTAFDAPVVVMVDRFSASASEIVAGAMQDYHRAVIVGTNATHGKGTVQIVADLDRLTRSKDELGSFKVTAQQFFRVNGDSTQWKGVVPDILLPDPAGHLETGERSLENSIPFSSIPPVARKNWTPTWKIPELAAASQKRVAGSDVFAKVHQRTELFKQRKDDTVLPLSRAAWTAKRKELRASVDAVSPDLEKGPARFAVTVLNYDGSRPVEARPGGRVDDRAAKWRDNVARDPWLEESLFVLADMAK